MKQAHRVISWMACSLALSACASGGGGPVSDQFTSDLGRQLYPSVEEARLKVWGKHNWHVRQELVEPNVFYVESEWRPFTPPEGAAVTGPEEARIRIVIRGRRVAGELDGGTQYRVTFEGDYEVRGGATPDWRAAPVPREAVTEFRRVLGDIELEIRTGVRR